MFEAWLALPDDQRKPMDAEFQEIFELRAARSALSALPNHYHRGTVPYLDHSECWKGATRFYHADTLPYGRKRKNMRHKPVRIASTTWRVTATPGTVTSSRFASVGGVPPLRATYGAACS